MKNVTKEDIKKIIQEVLNKQEPAQSPKTKRPSSPVRCSKALIIFHAGVRKLDEALNQTRIIVEKSAKSSVLTANSVRSWVCGNDIKEKAGVRCVLDTVKPDRLDKVLNKTDILVLPTFCFKVAAKVAHLTCNDQESGLVLSALLQGKKVLASNDGFLLCDMLVNEKIRKEIEQILSKLEGFGMVFCSTDQLSSVFQKISNTGQNPKTSIRVEASEKENSSAYKLITAKAIYTAVNSNQSSMKLAPGGNVTPLARDLAKEYSIKIIETLN